MACTVCFKKGKCRNFNPPEVDALARNEKFANMPMEDIMAFYIKFRSISEGQPFLNRAQFIDMLNSFNIFPNEQVARRMFDVVDFQNIDQIEFTVFMHYIFLLVDGSKEEKAFYIFKMITEKNAEEFNLENLVAFYKIIDYRDDQNASTQSFVEEKRDVDFEDMAKAVFSVMHKKPSEKIRFAEFKTRLLEQPEMLDLFNFLNDDLNFSIKGIRVKKTYIEMMTILKKLQHDIELLKTTLFDEPADKNYASYSFGKADKFNRTIISLAKQKIKKFPTDIGRNNMHQNVITNNSRWNEINMDDVSLDINLQKVSSNNNSVKTESDESLMKNAKARLFQTGPANLGTEQHKLEGLVSSISSKAQNLINILDKEIEATQTKEKFSYDLKNQLNTEKTKDNKKVVFINNPNWNIVTSMVSGIQKSMSIINFDKYKSLSEYDFKFKNVLDLQATNSVSFDKCKFKDYAPYIFQSIRRQSGISNDSYMKSIGVNTFRSAFFDKLYLMLSENSTGKSGSFFFHTSDGKYMIKTIKKNEFNVLKQTLSHYYQHILSNPNTFITKYFGLHKLKCYKKDKLVYNIQVVVMNNIFSVTDDDLIQDKYDLKGSRYNRITKVEDIKRRFAKKDLNFIAENRRIKISLPSKQAIISQISKDAEFLAKHQTIDYSLLIGVMPKVDERRSRRVSLCFSDHNNGKGNSGGRCAVIDSTDGQCTYFMGIIDTLTQYNMKKKSEYYTKRIFQGSGISCVPPNNYKDRFVHFISDCIDSNEEILQLQH